MKKTIKELNKKAWYRLLKVIFIIAFLVAGALIWEGYKPYDTTTKYVVCHSGQKYFSNPFNSNDYYTSKCNGEWGIKDITTTHNSWGGLFENLVALIIFFEIIRRIFYYIVLGTILPKNKEDN
jgi:hypothetical protein